MRDVINWCLCYTDLAKVLPDEFFENLTIDERALSLHEDIDYS